MGARSRWSSDSGWGSGLATGWSCCLLRMCVRGGSGGETVVEVVDCVADVFVDQVGIHGDGRGGARARGGDDLCSWVDDVSGGPDAGNAGASDVVDGDPAVGIGVAAKAD